MNTSRYQSAPFVVADGIAYFGFRALPDVSLRGDDRYYTVRPGEDLALVAFRLFGKADLWWVLADYNDFLDPFVDLYAGQILRYPSTTHLLLEVLRP